MSSVIAKTSSCRFIFCRFVSSSVQPRVHKVEQSWKYPIRVSVLLTRFPRITSDVSELQERFQVLRNQMEIEKSKLSEHEIELKRKSSTKNIVTAKDFEIAQQQKYDVFKPASRTTTEEDDPKSLNKNLSRKLVLTIKDKTLSEKQFGLPSTKLHEGESLRIAAERCLLQNCGTSIRAKFWSNAPNAVFIRRKLSDSMKRKLGIENAEGVNDFIFLVDYESHFESAHEEFAWIGKEELLSHLKNRKLSSIVSDLLYEF